MTPVVLISGWAHSAAFMQEHCGPFFDSSTSYDMSDLENHYAETLADHLNRTPEPTLLCGWSTGAMIALETTLLVPGKVKGLILFAGSARYCADEASPFAVPEKELKALTLSCRRKPAETVIMFRQRCGTANYTHAEASHQSLLKGLEYLADIDIRSQTSMITCPTLMFHGLHDQVVPPESGAQLSRLINTAELVQLKEARHACFLDAADEIRQKIASFIETL